MKLLVLSCLVAVCVASKVPMPPKFPETFNASGEIEFHLAERTLFGRFAIARDMTKQMGIEYAFYEEIKSTQAALLRYDEMPDPMAYYIRSDPKMGMDYCSPDKRNGTASKMPPFWSWLSLATYEGEIEIRHIKYDFWGYSVGDVRFELVVSKLTPNEPAYYNRKEAEDFVQYSFEKFEAIAPNPTLFTIPQACMKV